MIKLVIKEDPAIHTLALKDCGVERTLETTFFPRTQQHFTLVNSTKRVIMAFFKRREGL
jgi:hypothetical protein